MTELAATTSDATSDTKSASLRGADRRFAPRRQYFRRPNASPAKNTSVLHPRFARCSSLSTPFNVTSIDIEYGRGQMEMPLTPNIGVKSADCATLLRDAVREIATTYGWAATFCSKVAADGCGSGGHFNFSLRSAAPAVDVDKLSACFVAGVLSHAGALTALCCPSPPCYHRQGHFAPIANDFGLEDRMKCVREKQGETGWVLHPT